MLTALLPGRRRRRALHLVAVRRLDAVHHHAARRAGRGTRFGTTAAWFVVGATVGGVPARAPCGALAAARGRRVHLAAAARPVAALVACRGRPGADAASAGCGLPVHHRQVNERWLDQFRPWVYGAGFGCQIGSGLATYMMTAGVYLVVVLGALAGPPVAAWPSGLLFGLVRGLAVLLGRSITAPAALAAFHRRFEAWGPASRRLVLGAEVLAAVVFAGRLSTWAALVGSRRQPGPGGRPRRPSPDSRRAWRAAGPGDEPGPRLTPGPG